MSDPVKRRQYDSADFGITDEDYPTADSKGDFFELWRSVFELESRFSNIQPVMELGDMNAPKQHVERFYEFWYNFDSWRTFEWLDKDDVDTADKYVEVNVFLKYHRKLLMCILPISSRDNKRYIEKKNKAERARRKKEDSSRLHSLVG